MDDNALSYAADQDFPGTLDLLEECEELATLFTDAAAEEWPNPSVFCLTVAILATSISQATGDLPAAIGDDMRRYVGRKLVEAGHAMMGGVN